MSDTSGVTCSTAIQASDFKYQHHVFGRQEAIFNNVYLRSDMVLIGRVYMVGRHDASTPEELVAWSVIPLTVQVQGPQLTSQRHMNIGTHLMNLYEPPVPEPVDIPIEEHWQPKDWKRYRHNALLKIHIFQDKPEPGSPSLSEASNDVEFNVPEVSYTVHTW